MAKLRRVPSIIAQWDDGSAMGISGYDPDTPVEELLDRAPPVDPVWDIGEGADTQAKNIPGWASWTETEVLDWITANAASEIQAIAPNTYAMLRRMARMIVALRNKTWPQMEGNP